MDINNMKVTDLKKELKSRGLSIVGNKSELLARLESVLTQTIDNEDSVLNEEDDEILGSDLLDGSEGESKADDALIDDFLDNNLLTTNKPKTQTMTAIKRVTAAAAITSAKDFNETNPKNNDNSNKTQELPKDNNSTNLLKTSNAITLTTDEKKSLRAQKFGDNKLSIRAQRFGLNTKSDSNEPKLVSNTDSTNVNEKLKKRAERFGAIVSDKMKKIDASEKLLKRKERFGVITVTKTDSTISPNANKSKKAIVFSTKDDDRKRQRLERFGGVS
jgi:SAP domain-containing ribonucleoprotein